MNSEKLRTLIKPYLSEELLRQTRIHALDNYFPPHPKRKVFIKRDDELSSSIIGSKLRKYSSLLPYLEKENFDEVLIIGGAHSNNVLSLSQVLKEKRLFFKLMLLEHHNPTLQGNLLWTRMLVNEKNLIWVKRKDWAEVEEKAQEYVEEEKRKGRRVCLISEGAKHQASLPGVLTLPQEIVSDQEKKEREFQHYFIDSGTGLSAIGLILGLQFLEISAHIYISLIAGREKEFESQLENQRRNFSQLFGQDLPSFCPSYSFHRPALATSFGSVNTKVLQETLVVARETGILMDPVYSIKHLCTAKEIIVQKELEGNILFVYSGGSLALAGFQEKLAYFFRSP